MRERRLPKTGAASSHIRDRLPLLRKRPLAQAPCRKSDSFPAQFESHLDALGRYSERPFLLPKLKRTRAVPLLARSLSLRVSHLRRHERAPSLPGRALREIVQVHSGSAQRIASSKRNISVLRARPCPLPSRVRPASRTLDLLLLVRNSKLAGSCHLAAYFPTWSLLLNQLRSLSQMFVDQFEQLFVHRFRFGFLAAC